jgi:4-alpha-glucanotransferase
VSAAATPSLDALATQLGIEHEFQDARGERQRTSSATKRRVLAAMGISASDETQASESLATLERAQWERALPAVKVAYLEAGPPEVELVLPADHTEVRWRLVLETGLAIRGVVAFADLSLIAHRTRAEVRLEKRRLVLDSTAIEPGYHCLELEAVQGSTTVIVTPGRCWLPPAIARGERVWGLAVQLYSLRSANNWGIGDFGDLSQIGSLVAARGGDVLGVNPLHALFLDAPAQASPYSPASRLLLNVLNIDVTAIPELAQCMPARELMNDRWFRAQLSACRAASLVEYESVADLKSAVLHVLFLMFRSTPESSRYRAFEAFWREQSADFKRACLYQVLREHFAGLSSAMVDWRTWPQEFQDASSPEVAEFAEQHVERLTELAWLQWIADEQLRVAADSMRDMAVGLYRDMAVGADANGAETWSNPAAVISDARVGVPPDIHNPAGQNWGLPPFDPRVLRDQGYRGYIELLRANMRHSGGLRIDHVMALQRLYWIPQNAAPSCGAFVRYPLEDLIGILCLESQRHRCLIVGEDLGTVPEGLRARLGQANVLSYRVLYFEQDNDTGKFLAPHQYPGLALAVTGSHDLPTLQAWWKGSDLVLKELLQLYPEPGELRRAVHAFLARSAAAIAMGLLDDLTLELDPINVPATVNEYPNWRRRVSMSLEQLAGDAVFAALVRIFQTTRGARQP